MSGNQDSERCALARAAQGFAPVVLLLMAVLMVPSFAFAGQPSASIEPVPTSFGDGSMVTAPDQAALARLCDTFCLSSCAQDACPSGGCALTSEATDLPQSVSGVVPSTLPLRFAAVEPFKLLRPPRG